MQEEIAILRAEKLQVAMQYHEATSAMMEAKEEAEEQLVFVRELLRLNWEKLQNLRKLFKSDVETQIKARLWDSWLNEKMSKVSTQVSSGEDDKGVLGSVQFWCN